MKLLVAPLVKLGNLIEEEKKTIDEIHTVLKVDLKKASTETYKELKQHTVLLGEIRDLLKQQNSQKGEKSSGGPKIKLPSLKEGIGAGFAIVTMAAALVAAAGIFSVMPMVAPVQLLTALAVGGIMLVLAPIFVKISNSFERSTARLLVDKVTGNKMGDASIKGMMQNMGSVGLAVIGMAMATVVAANLFRLLPTGLSGAQFMAALATAIVLIPLSAATSLIIIGLRRSKLKLNKSGLQQIAVLPLIISAMALGIVGAAYAFRLLPSEYASLPDLGWVIKASLILFSFSFAFAKIAKAVKKLKAKDLLMIALAMPVIALGILLTAKVFTMMPGEDDFNSPPLLWAAKAGLAILIFSIPFAVLATFGGISKRNPKQLAMVALGMAAIAGAITATAWIFTLLPDEYKTPTMDWSLKAGLAILAFGTAFALIGLAISKSGKAVDFVVSGALGVIAIAGAILATAWIFSLLPDEYIAPPFEWTLKAGLAMAVFGVPFILVATLIKKAGIGFMDLIKATVSVALIAGSILATAWIFSFLPGEYKAPPMEWALSAGIAIGIFAIPFMIIGFIAKSGGGAAAIGLGALGMILIAGTMWVVAWIFSKMPDLSAIAKNFTDAIMYPVNSMIDALKRFKDEIGVENMLPMAGGILAIAGSWLALTAALAGSSIGGVLGAAANVGKALFDGIAKFFGGDAAETPISLLDKLIARRAGIEALAKAMPLLGGQFAVIAAHTDSVVRGIAAFVPFLNKDNVESFTKGATAAEKLATAYQKIGKATETMNIEAIKESRYMFEALTRLAEAGGEDALTVFAEKLMKAVEELSGTVENLQNAVGEQSSGIKDVVGGLLNKVTDKVKEVTGATAAADTKPEETNNNMSEVIELLSEIEERLNRPLRIIAE
jgi:hypothetical protein